MSLYILRFILLFLEVLHRLNAIPFIYVIAKLRDCNLLWFYTFHPFTLNVLSKGTLVLILSLS